jgi:carboxyl-terminal processing protease
MRGHRRYRHVLLTLLLASGVTAAQPWADDQPGLEDWEPRLRRVDTLLTSGDDAEAIEVLEALRGEPAVRARAEDYPRLLMLLARAYAGRGDAEHAIERVAEASALGHAVWRDIVRDDEFLLVRDDPRFAGLVERAQVHEAPWERVWSPLPELSRWSDTLPEHVRAMGISTLWSSAKLAYAYFDRLGSASWDSIYLETLAASARSPGTTEYYMLLQRMAARLGDGHTQILVPPELIDSFGFQPPLLTRLVDGHVLVSGILSPSLALGNMRPGDEIIAIDGRSVADYAATMVSPWISASSPQDMAIRSLEYYLLSGREATPARLSLERADGSRYDCIVARTWCQRDLLPRTTIDVRVLEGRILHMTISTFGDEYVVRLYDLAMRRHADARALIIDLRYNTGGQSRLAFEVLARLVREPFETHRWETPVYRGYFHARRRPVEWHEQVAGCMPGSGARADTRPVILLVGPRTLSAAENFVVAFDYAGRGVIIGEPTAGSTGHTLDVALPGGGSCRITTTRDYYPDGREYNVIGVQPHILVRPSLADVRAGRDPALEAALIAARAALSREVRP